ncbi:hypothetical protein OSTOST_10001 [Ostertagia ostertagi]
MSGPVVDILIRNDKAAALEALRNLWSYRLLETLHLESCDLTDQDLECIHPGTTCVRYVVDNGSECHENITVCLYGALIFEPACVTVRILETITLKLFT